MQAATAKATHIHVTQALVIAVVNQIGALVLGFGVVNSTTVGIVTNAAIAVVNVAFVIANSIHSLAHARVASPAQVNVTTTK